jgi:RHS repeat-associated protein
MLQSSWTDPVLGVDTHIVLVPSPAGPVPTPLPSPFTGMVLDPAGLAMNAAFGGSTVLVNSLPATHCGTAVKNMPPHLPVPGPFAKGKLDDDAKLLFGALNVNINGTLAVRLGDIALSCNDPVRMPTSTVLAIPKGPIVLVMPPMVPDLALIVQELAFAAFRWWQENSAMWASISKFFKFEGEELSRGQQLWNDFVCFLTGHPVDVATGRVITRMTDVELRGPLPLRFERRYDSAASNRAGTLAPGWSHNYGESLWPERGRFVYRAADGREIEFSTLHLPDRVLNAGDSVYLGRERLTLRCVRQYQYSVTDAKGTTRDFFAVPGNGDARGRARLVRIRTRVGDEQRVTYGADGRLDAVIDGAGRSLRFEYDRAGRLGRVHVVGTDDSAELVSAFTYDAAGDLVEARDALGHAYRYEYVEHLLVKETNKNGLAFYFQYDGADSTARCIRTWGDGGIYDHVITYTPDKTKTLVEDSLGHVTLYEMNARGQVVSVIDALGRKTAYEYDGDTGWKIAETDAAGAATKREYDERGNVVEVERPDGSKVTIDYGPDDQPLCAVDAIGGTWSWSYDARGRLVGRANPGGEKTQFHWDGPRLVAVTDAAGQRTSLGHDGSGNVTTLTTPDGATSAWSYDALGRLRTDTDVNGNVRRRHRDRLGRLERLDEPDGNQRTLQYDPEGNLVHAVDRQHDVRFEYRGMNRLAARAEAGARVKFHYDSEDRLFGVENEHGFAYRFVLDGVGDVAEEHGFDGLRRRYVRDAAGRVQLTARPEGQTTEYDYDAYGRVVQVKHSDGTGESYAYRKDGTLTAAKNGSAEIRFERDALGRVVKELAGDDWVSSTYDSLGRRRELRSSKGLFQRIRRNSMGNVVGLDAEMAGSKGELGGTHQDAARPGGDVNAGSSRPVSFSAAFTRDRMGLELERILPGGIRSHWHRDKLGRPEHQEILRGDTSIGARQYVWDIGNRLEKIIDALTGPIDYQHDVFGNLESARYADGHVDLRMPDAVGNLFRSSERKDRKYGPAGQLLEARTELGVTRYEYDAEGNLERRLDPDGRTWKYHFSASGMLTRVVRPDGREVTFGYDALGRRLFKAYRGKTTRWLWDGNVPLHEWIERGPDADDERERPERTPAHDGESSLAALLSGRPATGPPGIDPTKALAATEGGTAASPVTWLFHPESFSPLAKLVNGERYAIVADHLGTPRVMYDAAGDEVWAADLGAFGELREVRGERAACPFRWPGQYEDAETGLYYNRFRYYDPESGAYTRQDLLRLWGGPALYAYVADPLVNVDPFGLACDLTTTEDTQKLLAPPDTHNPWMPGTEITSGPAGPNTVINMVMAPGQVLPGGWGTLEEVPSVDFARQQLAIIPEFKPEMSHVQQFQVPEGTMIQQGIVGPQVANGVTYPGGASQVQILNFGDRAGLVPVGAPTPIF